MSNLWNEITYNVDVNQVTISTPGPQGPPGSSAASVQYSASTDIVISPAGIPTRYYGSFYDTTVQTASGTLIPTPIKLNSSDSASNSGVRVNSSSIIIDHSGVYNIQFSAQISTTKTSTVELWLKKNNSDVPWSNTFVSTDNQNPKVVAAWNFVTSASSGDWYQILWATTDVASTLYAASTAGAGPQIPSAIVTVTQV